MGVLDHVGVNVSSYARSKQFYEKALAPLGITVVMEYGSPPSRRRSSRRCT